jgi:gamma-glutamylcyclotransferase (GGCT)/AIG2-like uncharacterized protein YtfP
MDVINDEFEYLFVYGSLRWGLWNHGFLCGKKFVGMGKTVRRYAMYVCGIPYVVSNEEVSRIVGEVYLVDEECLREIDRLEKHPILYERKKVDVELENGDVVYAWMYFCDSVDKRNAILVRSGNYLDYLMSRRR